MEIKIFLPLNTLKKEEDKIKIVNYQNKKLSKDDIQISKFQLKSLEPTARLKTNLEFINNDLF